MRFFFDVHDNGESTHDDEGIDLADANLAFQQAAQSAAAMCADAAGDKCKARVEILVRDDSGDIGLAIATIEVVRKMEE